MDKTHLNYWNTNSNRLLYPFIFVIFILPKLKMVQFAKEVHAVVISGTIVATITHIELNVCASGWLCMCGVCMCEHTASQLFTLLSPRRSIKCYNFILSVRQPLKVESSSIFFSLRFQFYPFSLKSFGKKNFFAACEYPCSARITECIYRICTLNWYAQQNGISITRTEWWWWYKWKKSAREMPGKPFKL